MQNTLTQQLSEAFNTNESEVFISIYLRIRKATKGLEWQKLHFKQLVEQAEKKFKQQFTDKEWQLFNDEFQEVLSDSTFWDQHLGQSVGIFTNSQKLVVVDLKHIEIEQVHVSDLPAILPLVADEQVYPTVDILALQNKTFAYYKVRDGVIIEMAFPDDAPTTLTKALGSEKTDRMVNFNASPSGGSRNHGATFHGHSSADDEREVDQTNFFRAVSKYLQQHEDIDQNIPVVLFAEPRQQAVYREVSKSQRISEALSIDKSPAKLTLAEVRDAVSVIQTQWQALRTQSLTAQYDKAVGQQLVLDRIDTMIEPATNGQIRTLYVSPDSRFEGYFTADQEGQFTIVDQLQDDIIEKISDIVWQQGGDIEVVALQAIQSQSPAVAILRY